MMKLKRRPVDFDRAKEPGPWRDTSRRLLSSAELLWKPLDEAMGIAAMTPDDRSTDQKHRFATLADHYGAFFVIAGFAVENALKARIIDQHIQAGGVILDGEAALKLIPTTGHRLISLAKKAGVNLTPATEKLRLFTDLSTTI